MGAVLQQRVQAAWQPLAIFSRKLSPAQQKYSTYDRRLLAIYEAVRYFGHMLEARHFVIFTDHKPLTFAFSQKRDKCSPQQFNHLDFISQFTTDIRHISGQDVVADTLSRVEPQSRTITAHVATTSVPAGQRPNKTPIFISGVNDSRGFLTRLRASCPCSLTAQLKAEKLMVVPSTADGFRATVSALRSLEGGV
jgi:hypothetical protein